MITKPRSLKRTLGWTSLCVPMTTSTEPAASAAITASACFFVRNRESNSTDTGNSAMRSTNVLKCCCASTVVGTSTATCLPPITALNAARMATSVLPKPTSPQTSRSIGLGCCMSRLAASMAVHWSGVSSNGNDPSNSRCHGVSSPNACPGWASREACNLSKSAATSETAFSASALALAQRLPPRMLSGGRARPVPTYLLTRCASDTGTYSMGASCSGSRVPYSITRHSSPPPLFLVVRVPADSTFSPR